MNKKKKRDLNISIIGSGIISKGGIIIFIYCFIASLFVISFGILSLGFLAMMVGFEFLILNQGYRIKKLELQQRGEW